MTDQLRTRIDQVEQKCDTRTQGVRKELHARIDKRVTSQRSLWFALIPVALLGVGSIYWAGQLAQAVEDSDSMTTERVREIAGDVTSTEAPYVAQATRIDAELDRHTREIGRIEDVQIQLLGDVSGIRGEAKANHEAVLRELATILAETKRGNGN